MGTPKNERVRPPRTIASRPSSRNSPGLRRIVRTYDDDDDDDAPHCDVRAEPAVYHPSLVYELREQLMDVDAVLVWVNPIDEDGCDRTVLNDVLRDVSNAGIYVSAHPDVISIMGTKDILVKTRHMPWGVEDTVSYDSTEDMMTGLTSRLANGEIRVLKRNRGQSGNCVWLVQRAGESSLDGATHATMTGRSDIGGVRGGECGDDVGGMLVRVKHAARGGHESMMTLEALFDTLVNNHDCLGGNDDGRIIDMAYQHRLSEGMVRAYMVHNVVGGFGYRELNALHPNIELGPTGPPPQRYYSPDLEGNTDVPSNFHPLRTRLDNEWVPILLDVLRMESSELPILWDADFMLGPIDEYGNDTFVLCEINMSCVYPFPQCAMSLVASATARKALLARDRR